MSKLQLLYEKLMKIAFIFSAIFFILFLIDLFIAMVTGAFDCTNSALCEIKDDFSFFSLTLYPLGIGTLVFLISGRIFYGLVHRESDLLSVSEYKKSLEKEQIKEEDSISREQLYEKLRRSKREEPGKVSFFQKVGDWFKGIGSSIKEFFGSLGSKLQDASSRRKQKTAEKKELKEELHRIDEAQKEEEKVTRTKSKLNKTGLILLVSEKTGLSQNDSRLFLNTLLNTVRETVVANEEVKIAKFGRFNKVHVTTHSEVDETTGKSIDIEEHNTVEFTPFKQLLEQFEVEAQPEVIEEEVITEEPTLEAQPEPEVIEEEVITEEPTPEAQPEPEVIEEEVITEEPTPETQPEPEIMEEEVITEEPTPETQPEPEVIEEEVIKEEPVPEPEKVKEDVVQEELKLDTVIKEEPVEEKPVPVKQKKPAKPKVVTKTKKDYIEMMDATTDLSKNKANKFLKFFAEVVKEQLAEGDDIELEGIGFFTTIEMPAKEAVNPQTNEKIIVPAHRQVRLRFDDELKDKMNG